MEFASPGDFASWDTDRLRMFVILEENTDTLGYVRIQRLSLARAELARRDSTHKRG
jgi:hypothetical protein